MSSNPYWPDHDGLNERGCITLREEGDDLVEITPMTFGNWRLVLTPKASPDFYDFGWCYPDAVLAHFAAMAWDMNSADEPPAFHKRATHNLRRAPNRSANAIYRCEHGRWPGDECEHCDWRGK